MALTNEVQSQMISDLAKKSFVMDTWDRAANQPPDSRSSNKDCPTKMKLRRKRMAHFNPRTLRMPKTSFTSMEE